MGFLLVDIWIDTSTVFSSKIIPVTFPRNVGLCSWPAELLLSAETLPGAHLPARLYLVHGGSTHPFSNLAQGPSWQSSPRTWVTCPLIPDSIHRCWFSPSSCLHTCIQLVYVLLPSVLDSLPGLPIC